MTSWQNTIVHIICIREIEVSIFEHAIPGAHDSTKPRWFLNENDLSNGFRGRDLLRVNTAFDGTSFEIYSGIYTNK